MWMSWILRKSLTNSSAYSSRKHMLCSKLVCVVADNAAGHGAGRRSGVHLPRLRLARRRPCTARRRPARDPVDSRHTRSHRSHTRVCKYCTHTRYCAFVHLAASLLVYIRTAYSHSSLYVLHTHTTVRTTHTHATVCTANSRTLLYVLHTWVLHVCEHATVRTAHLHTPLYVLHTRTCQSTYCTLTHATVRTAHSHKPL